MIRKRNTRSGSTVVMLLVVLLVVGLLTHQTVRSLSIFRQSQDRQARIRQANQLLELGRSLDRQQAIVGSDNSWQRSLLIVPVGSDYGRLEAVDHPHQSGLQKNWVATLPVDVHGAVIPSPFAVVVSCERSN